jgi:2'-5' RNA ligase
MAGTTRTFLAVPIAEPIVAALSRLRQSLDGEAQGLKWVEARHYHITLAFLGDVADRDLGCLGRAVAEASAPFAAFALEIEGLGAFPKPNGARVLWAGVAGTGTDPLAKLRASVVQAAAGVAYEADDVDRFHPHVTLARFKGRPGRGPRSRPPDLSHLVARHAAFSSGPFRVGEVIAFASTLRPEGPEYTALTTARLLGGGDPEAREEVSARP